MFKSAIGFLSFNFLKGWLFPTSKNQCKSLGKDVILTCLQLNIIIAAFKYYGRYDIQQS